MPLPTEPIGSVPRPPELIEALQKLSAGAITRSEFEPVVNEAVRDTIRRFEETGSPVITDGEQAKPSFATYPLNGIAKLAPDGVTIPFEDGHTRQLPKLIGGPFRYALHADSYLKNAMRLTSVPIKQAVISVSALSLLYPDAEIAGYSRDQFEKDLLEEAEQDIRGCLEAGAHCVQIDFTEGRLSLKLDPSGGLLRRFIALNNQVLDRFTPDERSRIGVHSCPGGDQDSTHSASVDYAELLPALFSLGAGRFYLQLASEPDRRRVLALIRQHLQPGQLVFVGVTDPITPRIESASEVCKAVLEAADFIPPERLGTTDDCGFAPFADDTSTARDIAFDKIRARVEGTRMAGKELGIGQSLVRPNVCGRGESAAGF
jgi:5-methyltetrahydropteroyltriglutamate--homocysteine methyltransferase